MPVSVAEYLGQRTDSSKTINPAPSGAMCAFSTMECKKITSYHKPPVCSVRKINGGLYIVCEHRLCSSQGEGLSNHQKDILHQIAKEIFDPKVTLDEIIYKKETGIATGTKNPYRADYVLRVINKDRLGSGPPCVVVEMQGGGETSNTGQITNIVKNWERNASRTNTLLTKIASKAGTIETNAWRRQQEQFLVKGNSSLISGFGMVLCVGESIYQYIHNKLGGFQQFADLRDSKWNFALIPFIEGKKSSAIDHIPLKIEKNKVLYTKFKDFSKVLTSQGEASPQTFIGNFTTLNGKGVTVK